MFVKASGMKKLMKSAWKGYGLLVGMKDGTIILGGSWWEVKVKEEFVPKEILAAIIEITGELPKEGEVFSSTEEGNQMESFELMEEEIEGYEEGIVITDFALAAGHLGGTRILQDRNTGKMYLVDNTILNVTSNKDVEISKKEEPYMGPWFKKDKGIMFKNNVMTLRAGFVRNDQMQQILDEMTNKGIKLIPKEGDSE